MRWNAWAHIWAHRHKPISAQGQRYSGSSNDIVYAGTARQVTDRSGEALQNRADCLRTGKLLGQLVADIAGIQIRENKHIGLTGHRTGCFQFFRGHPGGQCSIRLEFTIEQ